MFHNQLTSVMLMLLLSFSGTLLMFFFVIRSLSSQREETRDLLRRQQMLLVDLEQLLQEVRFNLRRMQGGAERAPGSEGAGPSGQTEEELLFLNKEDSLSSLLEGAASRHGGLARPGGGLLPSTAAHSAGTRREEEYDPVSDPNLFDDSETENPFAQAAANRESPRPGTGMDESGKSPRKGKERDAGSDK